MTTEFLPGAIRVFSKQEEVTVHWPETGRGGPLSLVCPSRS